MNDHVNQHELAAELEAQSDDALHTLITRARGILAARQEQQKKDALSEIRRIARAHGIEIAVKKTPGRPGRPPKGKADREPHRIDSAAPGPSRAGVRLQSSTT